MDAKALDALAKRLKLTPKERRLAELMAADPSRAKWQAARDAGYGGGEKGASVAATRTLAKARVREFLAAISTQAEAQVVERTGHAVASLSVALEHATAIMEVNIPACLRQDGELDIAKVQALPEYQQRALMVDVQTTTNEEGQAFYRHKVKADPTKLAAAKFLRDHHEGVGKPADGLDAGAILAGLMAMPQAAQEAFLRAVKVAQAKEVGPLR